MASETVCITTWLEGSWAGHPARVGVGAATGHLLQGAISMRYRIAHRSTLHPGDLDFTTRTYSTPEGARRAAKGMGLAVLRGVAQGHEAARKMLGLPPSPEWLARAARFVSTPTPKFLTEYVDAFAA